MAQRLAQTIRIDASDVQGEGAYVEMRKFTWGEQKDVLRKLGELESSNPLGYVEATEKLLIEHLIGWNWVDDRGALLDVPRSPDALNVLTSDEINFLIDKIKTSMRLGETQQKN